MLSKQFLHQVTSYIRSKEARRFVEEELQHHLNESKQAWMNKGYSVKEAEEKAIAEMGSATQLGKSMDKIHKPKWDFWLIGAVVLLMAASFMPITMDYFKDKLFQIIMALIGITVLLFFDYKRLKRYSSFIYVSVLLFLAVLTFMPTFILKSEAMYYLGPFRLQAMLVLPFLFIALAAFFSERKWKGWQLPILTVMPLCFFFMLPSLSVMFLYIAVVAVLFGYSYYNRKQKVVLFTVAGVFSLLGVAFSVYAYHFLVAAYQTERIRAFLNPERYADTSGYMILQLRQALTGAGLFGAKETINIPAAHTDFALVNIIQNYGYVAGIAIIGIIFVIALRIFWIVRDMPLSFGKLLIISLVTLYSVQSLYSILMVFGLLPLVSIPLPFISYGMTPLLFNTILIGLVLSVYRRKSIISTKMATN